MQSFKELVGKFEDRFSQNSPFSKGPRNLYEPCSYLVGLGGKRVRPVACLMANELFGDITEDAWHAAFGLELFHTFTLIHDDIMDKAPLRRGFPTVHAKYGLTAGILCGDVMSIYAYDHIAMVKTALPQVLHLFNKTAIEVCEGQQWDMDFETRDDVSIDEYLNMIFLKTSVLLAASLKIGGLLGGATEGNADKLYTFGKNLGIAFQLQDDYLDAFGDVAKTGKQNGGDIRDNKKTFLLLTALADGTAEQVASITNTKQLLSNDDNKVSLMLDLFRKTRADVKCLEAVKHYSDKAFECLEEVAVVSKRKKHLHDLASYLLLRDK